MKKKFTSLLVVFLLIGQSIMGQSLPNTIRLQTKLSHKTGGLLQGQYGGIVTLIRGDGTSKVVSENATLNFVDGVTSFTLSDFNQGDLFSNSAYFQISFSSSPVSGPNANGEVVTMSVTAVPLALNSVWAHTADSVDWANVTNTPNIDDLSGTISAAQIANSTITSAMIADGAVTNAKITGPIDASKISGAVGSIQDNTVGSAAIINGSITNTDLATGNFTSIQGLGTLTSQLNLNQNLRVSDNVLYVDSTAKRVGIGTTLPDTALDIVGQIKLRSVSGISDNNSVLTVQDGVVRFIDTTSWNKDKTSLITTFKGLTDTPNDFSGLNGQLLQVSSDGTRIVTYDPSNFMRSNANVTFSGSSFGIASGSTLNITSGAVLDVDGVLNVDGTLRTLGALNANQIAVTNGVSASSLTANSLNLAGTTLSSIGNGLNVNSGVLRIAPASAANQTLVWDGSNWGNAAFSFSALSDTESSYTGKANYLVRVNSAATGLEFVSDSALSLGDASTLDNVDSLSFLRSDQSDNFTSGSLTFNSGTSLVLSSGSVLQANQAQVASLNVTNAAFSGTIKVGDDTINDFVTSGSGLAIVNNHLALLQGGSSKELTLKWDPVNTQWQLADFPGALNTSTQAGIVSAGSGNANKVWKTDSAGNPAWRDDSALSNSFNQAGVVAGPTATDLYKVWVTDASGNPEWNAVGTNHISASAVTTPKINDAAVTTAKINDSAVTTAKINDAAITTVKINDSSVTTAKLNDLAVTTAKIASDAITSSKILDGEIVNADISASAAISQSKITNLTTDLAARLVISNNLSDLNNVSTARTNLGVAIGTDVQAFDAGLDSISGLTTGADTMIYTTGADVYATTALTSAARNLLDDADVSAMRTTLGLGSAAQLDTSAFAAADAGLSSIAGLTTAADTMIYTTGADTYATTVLTSAARSLLDDADVSAMRSTLGLVIGTDVQTQDAGLDSISGLTTGADTMIYTTGADTYTTTALTSAARSLLDDADASAMRSTLGLGSAAQLDTSAFVAADAGLSSIAGLTTAADTMIYTTGADTYTTTALTSAARSLLDDADASAMRSTLGLVIGTDVQTQDAGLSSIAGLTTGVDTMIYTTAADTYATTTLTDAARNLLDDASASVMRLTLGLGTAAQVDTTAFTPADSGLISIAGLTTAADTMIYTTAADTYSTTPLTVAARNLLDDADASAMRSTLGLGSAAQSDSSAFITADAGLSSIAGLTTAADTMIYTTGADTYATATLTSAARNLLDDADASTMRTTLGVAIGTNVQAYDADLDDLADGSLSGSKVGSGINASNITTGTLSSALLPESLTVKGLTVDAATGFTDAVLTVNGSSSQAASTGGTVSGLGGTIKLSTGGSKGDAISPMIYSGTFTNTSGSTEPALYVQGDRVVFSANGQSNSNAKYTSPNPYYGNIQNGEQFEGFAFNFISEQGGNLVGLQVSNAELKNEQILIGVQDQNNQTVGMLAAQDTAGINGTSMGIKLESAGADYAEYLYRLHEDEAVNAADIVGVFDGKITKNTSGAQRVMVVSTAPLVLGNRIDSKTKSLAAPVAFVGQVPVKVRGKVNSGDYIIPSGKNDGVGVAVSPQDITSDQALQVVGRAWESSNKLWGESTINVAITPLDNAVMQSVVKDNASLKSELNALKAEVQELKALIQNK